MMFADRRDAGRRLASELQRFRGENPVVLGLARGGVPVGCEIGLALHAPLDVLLVRKIGVPWQPELAAGAIVDGAKIDRVIDRNLVAMLSIPQDYLEKEADRQAREIERRRKVYFGDRAPIDIAGRSVIVTDDGIATGSTMRAVLLAMRRRSPARIILAIPVAPPDSIAGLAAEADEIVCLATPAAFGAISQFYEDFHQVDDAEVVAGLERAAKVADARGSTSGEQAAS
jgi:putative phosphoribosyl transferase